jgi:hypothetical protein
LSCDKGKGNCHFGVVIESCTKGVWSDYVMGLFQGLVKIILQPLILVVINLD